MPGDQTNTDTFPADFFRNAGLISTTDGTGLRVSDNDFGDVKPSYADEFESFSKAKTFTAVGSARMTVEFRGTWAPISPRPAPTRPATRSSGWRRTGRWSLGWG